MMIIKFILFIVKLVIKIILPSVESILKFSNNSYKIFSYCDYVSKDAYELMLYNYQNNKFTNIKINN